MLSLFSHVTLVICSLSLFFLINRQCYTRMRELFSFFQRFHFSFRNIRVCTCCSTRLLIPRTLSASRRFSERLFSPSATEFFVHSLSFRQTKNRHPNALSSIFHDSSLRRWKRFLPTELSFTDICFHQKFIILSCFFVLVA